MTTRDSKPQQPPFALSEEEYELVGSLVETFVPSGEDREMDPGAREVGAKNYFDSELLNYLPTQRSEIRLTLSLIEEEAARLSGGSGKFSELSEESRVRVVKNLISNPPTRSRLLEIRSLCLEGFYSDYRDPGYAGKSGWEWTGYEGKGITGLKKDWSFLEIYRQREGIAKKNQEEKEDEK